MLEQNVRTPISLLCVFFIASCKASIDATTSKIGASDPNPSPTTEDICTTTPEDPSCANENRGGGNDNNSNNTNDPTLPVLVNMGLKALHPGSEIASIFLKSTGAPATSCTVTPPLPLGLTLGVHEGGCRISGSPQALHAATEHTVTATAASGKSDTATVTIEIEKSEAAPVLIASSPQSYVTGLSAEPLLLTNLGLDAISCSANPALPNGLSVEAHSGSCRVVGTPATTASGTYTITAKASDDSESSVSINLSVVAAAPPVLADAGSQSYEVGQAIATLTFTNSGAAVKANGCSVNQTLPAGLSLSVHSNSCRISGTPTALQASSSYTVTALAADGSSDTASVSIAVVDTTDPVIANTTVTASSDSQTSMTLNWTKATDLGTAPADLEYKVCYDTSAPAADCSTGTVAQNFTKDINSVVISSLSSNTLYHFRVVVKDASNNLSSYAAGAEQTAGATPVLADVASAKSYEVGAAITALDFTNTGAAVKTGGCSINPALPTGLSLTVHGTTCRISGTPTALQAATSYAVTAESADGSTDTTTVSIAVVDTTAPTVSPSASITPSSVTKTGFVLTWTAATDNHTDGAALAYKVCYHTSVIADSNCSGAAVAENFTANITTTTLSGLNSNTIYHYRVFVRDSALNIFSYTAGSEQTLADPPIIQNQGSKSFVTTVAITGFDFANSGAAITSCAINPLLTATGLTFNAATCGISGTPSGSQAATLHTVTATAADGSSDTATVTITINAANPPVFDTPSAQTFVTTVPVSFSLTKASGGDAANCESSPPLPSTLSVAANLGTCRISGTPNNSSAEDTYTITATGADGTTGTVDINITVNTAVPPSLADINDPVELTANVLASDIEFTNTGAAVVDCEVSPSLPAGLTLDDESCTISGTPTTPQGNILYTVTATSADGSQNTASVTISVGGGTLTCPTGYIPVPQYTDDDTGTVPAFCVMKYEAKNDGSNKAVSVVAGEPWHTITRTDAISRCQEIDVAGYNFDMITNAQWQSMARQIERYESAPGVYVNWQNNSTSGTNSLNRGNSDSSYRLAADADDANGCLGTTIPNTCNNTWHLNKRTHTLPNGEIIWDLAGNVWEWVKDNSSFNYDFNGYWYSATSSSGSACTSPGCTGPQGTPKAAFGPYGSYSGKTSSPYGGLGYGWTGYTVGAVIRGGYCDSGGLAGLFTANLNYGLGNDDNFIGFRCAAIPVP